MLCLFSLHLQTATSDSDAAPVPTLTIHPPTPVSKSPTVGTFSLHVHSSSGSGLPKSSATTSMLSPSHRSPLHPSPPSHSPTHPHTSSPPRYGRLGTSPASREASHSPSSSPRTYSIPSSASPSPKAYSSPPASSEPAHLRHSPSMITTTAAEHAQYSRQGYGSGAGQLSALLRGTDQTSSTVAAPSAHQSRDERIRALTQSALRLKERIAMESKKFEEATFGGSSQQHFPPSQQQQWSPPIRPLFSHQTNEQGFTPSADLPGVRNVHEHALRAERLRQEAEAATKIQAAYRGHRVRQSLHWKLPSGQTLGASLRGGPTHRVDEDEGRESSSGTLTPDEEDENEEERSTPVISPLHGPGQRQANLQSRPQVSVAPQSSSSTPAAVPHLSPWQQTGGDAHSVINVFTRQHERLRQTLDQLSDQKRAEIRRFGGEEGKKTFETPRSGSSPVSPASQPMATSVSHSYSYTHTFEEASPSKQSASDLSPRSSNFSEDSLHISSPKQESSSKASPSPSSSPHLLHHTSLSPSQSSGGGGGSSPAQSSKSESGVQHGNDKNVHVITPPGSPSFVESFASQSPRSGSSQTEPKSLPKSPIADTTTAQSAHPPLSSSGRSAPLPPPPGRLSPRSLELKLQSELSLLETVEDSMRHLSQVESARAVSLAQQETVALAQLLKSSQQGHEQELQSVASRTEKDVEDARGKLDREAALLSEQRRRMEKEHAEELVRLREEASRASREATLRANEARTAASEAVIQAAKDQLEAAHTIATSAASAAAREAVKLALTTSKHEDSPLHKVEGSTTTNGTLSPTYESDFETDSLAGSESGKDSEVHPKPKSAPSTGHASTSSTSTVEEEIEREGERHREDKSATPVAPPEEVMEVTHGDVTLVGDDDELEESYQSQSPVEELEDGDISEVLVTGCLLYTSPSPRDATLSRMPSSA